MRKLLYFLLVLLLLMAGVLVVRSLYIVQTAPVLSAPDIERVLISFDKEKYQEYYDPDMWSKYSYCSGMWCWDENTLSPLFSHAQHLKGFDGIGIDNYKLREIENELPYYYVSRDALFDVYWIDEYGPFKFNFSNTTPETLPVVSSQERYDKDKKEGQQYASTSDAMTISEDTITIEPYLVRHKRGTAPELIAYKHGEWIVVKVVTDMSGETSAISGTIDLSQLPEGDYKILHLKVYQQTEYPEESDDRRIVNYFEYTKSDSR